MGSRIAWKAVYGIGWIRSTSGLRSLSGWMTLAPSSGSPTYITAIPTAVWPLRWSGTNSSGGAVTITHAVESSSGALST